MKDRRTTPDRRVTPDKSVYLKEACGNAARVWVLNGAKPEKIHIFVEYRWVEVGLKYNGEENPPRRREADKEVEILRAGNAAGTLLGDPALREGDYLAPETDARQAATAKRLEDLGSDRSADA